MKSTMAIGERRWARAAGAGLAALLMMAALSPVPAAAFTDKEIAQIFDMLDTDHDGKISRREYDANKIHAFYRDVKSSATLRNMPLKFDENTPVSRQFFDAADTNHDGVLTGGELADALPYTAIDRDAKGYITRDDLSRFLKSISR